MLGRTDVALPSRASRRRRTACSNGSRAAASDGAPARARPKGRRRGRARGARVRAGVREGRCGREGRSSRGSGSARCARSRAVRSWVRREQGLRPPLLSKSEVALIATLQGVVVVVVVKQPRALRLLGRG